MADGFLEKHYEDYEARKAAWLRKQQGCVAPKAETSSQNTQKKIRATR